MMFSFICHHFVVGGEEEWNIPIRESGSEGGEGEGLKKLTSFLISGLHFLCFVGLFIWMLNLDFICHHPETLLFLILDGSSRIFISLRDN